MPSIYTILATIALAAQGAIAASNSSAPSNGTSGGGDGTVYTTEVVTAYTTYCPSPTQITNNGKTITVHSATTLTVTDCPCTITRPVTPSTATHKPSMSVFHGAGATHAAQGIAAAAAAGLLGFAAVVL